MPGQPKYQDFLEEIERQGGADEAIFFRIAAGDLIKDIADDLGVSYAMLNSWMHKGGEEREKKWDRMKQLSAEAHAEKSFQILRDFKGVTSSEARIASKLSDRHWGMAKVRDRDTFGDKPNAIETAEDFAEAFVRIIQKANTDTLPPEDPVPELSALENDTEPEEADYEILESDAPEDSLEGSD